jgi:hypothetical protein
LGAKQAERFRLAGRENAKTAVGLTILLANSAIRGPIVEFRHTRLSFAARIILYLQRLRPSPLGTGQDLPKIDFRESFQCE